MKTVKIKNITIGSGLPKICVPIVGKSKEAIIDAAKLAKNSAADLAEWRADYFEDIFESPKDSLSFEKIEEILHETKNVLGGMPLIFTFRTLAEGGETAASLEQYLELNRRVADTGYADLIDIEFFCGERSGEKCEENRRVNGTENCGKSGGMKRDEHNVPKIVKYIHERGGKVILSNHDFSKTPPKGEIINRFRKMTEADADIAKIAVMPNCREDVSALMSATASVSGASAGSGNTDTSETRTMSKISETVEAFVKPVFSNLGEIGEETEKAAAGVGEEEQKIPLIAISMGKEGCVSRFAGEIFGSAVTFGALSARAGDDSGSAPGQIEVGELRNLLESIHKECISGKERKIEM